MWVGAISLFVQTGTSVHAGTDSDVTASVVRDDFAVADLALGVPHFDDLERGSGRFYNFESLARKNDRTPELPPSQSQSPMPFPESGIEFSDGLEGHLKLVLSIGGRDLWVKDRIDLFIKQSRFGGLGGPANIQDWVVDDEFTFVASWGMNVAMSRDPAEGHETWTMRFR
jgi:hypothetical protein